MYLPPYHLLILGIKLELLSILFEVHQELYLVKPVSLLNSCTLWPPWPLDICSEHLRLVKIELPDLLVGIQVKPLKQVL